MQELQSQALGFFRWRILQDRNHDYLLAMRAGDHGPVQTDTGPAGLLPGMLLEPQSHINIGCGGKSIGHR